MVQLSSNGKTSLSSGIAFLVLATVAVALRFYTKTLTKLKWAADDYWIGLSLISFFAWIGVEFWGVFLGSDGENLETYWKSLYTINPLFGLTVAASKLSILSLYRRIFISKRFQQVNLVIGGSCILFWIIFTIVTLNICQPVRKAWRIQTPGHCYDFNQLQLGFSIGDIVLDASILILPIKPVLGLQISKSRKTQLCTIFLVGGFVIITGIVRLALAYSSDSENISLNELWGNIHLGTAILCACLPTYGPILSRLTNLARFFSTRLSSLFNSRRSLNPSQSRGGYSMGAYAKGLNHYDPLSDSARHRERLRQVSILHVSRGESSDNPSDGDRNHISVVNTVDVV